MPRQRPANLAISELLGADLTRKSPIGLVKDILRADLDLRIEMLTHEKEEEAGRCNDDFGTGIQGGFV